jgi:hypothetical protein
MSMPTATSIGAMALLALCAAPVAAQTASGGDGSEVKGINPADVLNRADVITKIVNLPTGESVTLVGKYDMKLGQGLGASFELPVLSHVNVGVADATGIGDLFARVRFVRPLSRDWIGLVSLEGVAPTASNALLGTGKWMVNPAAGVVKLWGRKAFTVALYKHSFSVAGKDNRPDISVNQLRALQSFVLDRGWYVTFDGKHEWQTRGTDESWTTGEFEVGRQFSARWAASARIGKSWGDRRTDGTLELNVRTFF